MQHRAPSRARLGILAVSIKSLSAEDRRLIDQCVTTAVRIHKLARYNSGLAIIHKPHDLDGKLHDLWNHTSHSNQTWPRSQWPEN